MLGGGGGVVKVDKRIMRLGGGSYKMTEITEGGYVLFLFFCLFISLFLYLFIYSCFFVFFWGGVRYSKEYYNQDGGVSCCP